jgi:RimJ/RimL family protein N-acetyltransferase
VTAQTLQTPRLLLRQWQESDAEALVPLVADAQVAQYMFYGRPLDADGARAVYDRRVASWRDDGFGFWAVELRSTGEFIGWTGLQVAHAHPDLGCAVEVGWLLAPQRWGCGYATEAAEASLRYGFEQLELKRIYAFYIPENRRSEAVMERLGMEPAGETVDVRDGSVSKLRTITRAQWGKRTTGVGA